MTIRGVMLRAQHVPVSHEKRAIRQELVEAQGNRCGICGEVFTPPHIIAAAKAGRIRKKKGRIYKGHVITIEHVTPITVTTRFFGNVVAAHLSCNAKKADRMPTGCELIWLAAANAGLG